MCENANVKLKLNWYEVDGNNFIGEELIRDMSEKDILNLFDAPFWNKTYQCWSVENSQIETLQDKVEHIINIDEHSYFVEIFSNT